MKLIALPFAGGMGNEFKSWELLMGKEVELITVQYPGRGQRSKVPYMTNFKMLLEDIYTQVEEIIKDEREYMLLGHSMGCILTYELYFKLKAAAHKLPLHIFFSGNYTPKECLKDYKKSELSEEKFREYFVQLGGISTRILEDELMSEQLFKRLRYDVAALENYRYVPKTEQILCDVSILNGTQDSFVSSKLSWENVLKKKCAYCNYEGGHFFIFNQRYAVIHYIKEIIMQKTIAPVV